MTPTNGTTTPINPELLEILRCPQAVQEKGRYGADPGRLELVHNSWLVSPESGLKYPIRDGIPIMLIDEGMRWKDTPVEGLPVPPPAAAPAPSADTATRHDAQPAAATSANRLPLILGALLAVIALIWLLRPRN